MECPLLWTLFHLYLVPSAGDVVWEHVGWHTCGSSPSVCGGCQGQAGRQGKGASVQTCLGEGGAPWEQPLALGDIKGEGGGELPGHAGWWQGSPPRPAPISFPILQAGWASAQWGTSGRGHSGLPPADH